MTVLITFLESSLNFLSNNLKIILKNLVQSGRKAVSKLELAETLFARTVNDKILCKTHMVEENYCFKHIFGIFIKFPIH